MRTIHLADAEFKDGRRPRIKEMWVAVSMDVGKHTHTHTHSHTLTLFSLEPPDDLSPVSAISDL